MNLLKLFQPKHEYVLCINMTKYQKKLYKHYLENFARAGQIGHDGKLEGGKKGGLFYDVQYLSRIWNHPFILTMAQSLADEKKYFEDNGGEDDNMRVSWLLLFYLENSWQSRVYKTPKHTLAKTCRRKQVHF